MKEPHRLNISGEAGTLSVEGELDAYTAPQLEEALDAAGAGEGPVRLHLAGVEFIDSTGIRAIVRADQALRATDRRLVIVEPSTAVARLLELTALDEHLDIDAGAPS